MHAGPKIPAFLLPFRGPEDGVKEAVEAGQIWDEK